MFSLSLEVKISKELTAAGVRARKKIAGSIP
jgi:hypothetical protein